MTYDTPELYQINSTITGPRPDSAPIAVPAIETFRRQKCQFTDRSPPIQSFSP